MIYANLHSSFLRFCADFAAAHNLVPVNFDAHAGVETLPNSDLIGMASLSFTEDEGLLSIKVMLGISTLNDENNFRLVKLVSELFELLRPNQRLTIYRADTDPEVVAGWMICQDGTTVLPVGGEVARPLQYVAVHLATSVEFK